MNPLIKALYKELEQDCPDSLSMLESFGWDKEGIHTKSG